MQTEYAEYIIKFGHQVIHTLTIIFATKISYLYYAPESYRTGQPTSELRNSRAQLIGFIMLANVQDKEMYSEMYNDELMMLYLLLSVYSALKDQPTMSSVFFTLAMSMKAGAILMVPAFLGSMFINYGAIELFKNIFIVVGFQVLIALPFILNGSTVKDYLVRSKLTGSGRQGIGYAAEFWDYLAAPPPLSIFWTFLDEQFYMRRDGLALHVKAGMFVANIYHFFFRKQLIIDCFLMLNEVLSLKFVRYEGVRNREHLRLTAEILIIGYLSGVYLMPGANLQFQFWFTPLIPLLIEMVGVPQLLTFWIYGVFFPVNNRSLPKEYQHFLGLALVAWLLTIGPQDYIFDICCNRKPRKESRYGFKRRTPVTSKGPSPGSKPKEPKAEKKSLK